MLVDFCGISDGRGSHWQQRWQKMPARSNARLRESGGRKAGWLKTAGQMAVSHRLNLRQYAFLMKDTFVHLHLPINKRKFSIWAHFKTFTRSYIGRYVGEESAFILLCQLNRNIVFHFNLSEMGLSVVREPCSFIDLNWPHKESLRSSTSFPWQASRLLFATHVIRRYSFCSSKFELNHYLSVPYCAVAREGWAGWAIRVFRVHLELEKE